MNGRRIAVLDTTLRDGAQAAGAGFTLAEKLALVQALSLLRVDIIEAGFPAASLREFEACSQAVSHLGSRSGAKPAVAVMCRSLPEDIVRCGRALGGAENGIIHLSLPVSDLHMQAKFKASRRDMLKKAEDAIAFALGHANAIEMGAEDATRADPEFLADYCSCAIRAGAGIVNIADTVGISTPRKMQKLIAFLLERVPGFARGAAVLSVHCHNDLGLATANTLSAIEAGCGQIETSLRGIGERAGNAALEEIAAVICANASAFPIETNLNLSKLAEASALAGKISGLGIPPFRAVWGSTASAHASGIHQSGIQKDANTYRAFQSELLGFSGSRTAISQYSGKAGLAAFLKEYAAIDLSQDPDGSSDAATQILRRIKEEGAECGLAEILGELRHAGLYDLPVLAAEVAEDARTCAQKPIPALKQTIDAMRSDIENSGADLPELSDYSIIQGPLKARVFLEFRHPCRPEETLAFERTGEDAMDTVRRCFLDAANSTRALRSAQGS